MDLGLRGKIALVCGGSRGIGFAAAEEFVREGALVAISGRDAQSLAAAKAKLAVTSADVLTVEGDLATPEGIEKTVQAVRSRFGHVDVLVTNTGGPPTTPALDADWAAWEKASNLLLRSAVELTRAFVPGMRERKWGRVIGITSLAVKQPVSTLVLSNAMRSAVTAYFRTLANEIGADGVTVNTVLPGYTVTERLDALAEATSNRTGATREAVFDQWRAITPAGRLGKPDELAAVIAFLASDRAGFITGQAICVDGGAVKALF